MIDKKWHIQYAAYTGGFQVYIKEGDARIVEKVTFTTGPIKEGLYYEPSMILEANEAQQIMDQLWNAGVRPRNGEGSNAQVEAMKLHLQDMRKLVFADQAASKGDG